MKIKIKIQKKDMFLLLAISIFFVAVTYVVAYNPGGTGNPAVMGHSFNELENTQYKITNGLTACSTANLAIKTINPITGAVTCETDEALPSGCANNQVAKWNGASWVCSNDINTDTKCTVSGSCAQVCVGASCRNSWPAGPTFSVCAGGSATQWGDCKCGIAITVSQQLGPCTANSDTGSCSEIGDLGWIKGGECCVCRP